MGIFQIYIQFLHFYFLYKKILVFLEFTSCLVKDENVDILNISFLYNKPMLRVSHTWFHINILDIIPTKVVTNSEIKNNNSEKKEVSHTLDVLR